MKMKKVVFTLCAVSGYLVLAVAITLLDSSPVAGQSNSPVNGLSVQVNNSSVEPVPVFDVDNSVFQPFQFAFPVSSDPFPPLAVPEGKRLVIEHVTSMADSTGDVFWITVGTTAGGQFDSHLFPMSKLGVAVGAPHASGAPPDAIIHPTGLFPDDVQNVQEAVDAGGTILLKATDANGEPASFNFGPATTDGGFVHLTNDVVVLGETIDGHMTTIDGGNRPFVGFTVPVNSAFRGIHFNGPRTAAVVMSHSSGFEFFECWVHDVIGEPIYPETKGQAVWMNGPPGGITGRLRITGNLVEDIHAEVGYGFAIFGYDAEAEIIDNGIFGANTAGILVGLNSQPTLIEDNLIVPGPERFPFGSSGNGILAVRPTASTGTYRIADNVVVCENPLADGIYFLGVLAGFLEQPVVNSVIEQNDVEMYDSQFSAIALYGAVSDCVVRNNNLRGTGAYALQIGAPFLGGPAANNSLIGNNLSHFEALVPSYDWGDMADVFLDVHSQDTVVDGLVRSVIDLGVDNRVSAPK